MNTLRHFVLWLDVPLEQITHRKIEQYMDHLLGKKLKAKTINCHIQNIRSFYDYLYHYEEIKIVNPVKKGAMMRLSKPLPRHLKDDDVLILFDLIERPRDRAMFKIMLRCGLRVQEVANLTLGALDLKHSKILVHNGKGGKGRVVYISTDAYEALIDYLRVRPQSRAMKVFLVEKGTYYGKPISVRGIQKRIEYYATKTGLKVCCHALRHTMATQLLNADAEVVTIQDLLGHSWISTTERYCTVSNLKVMRDYFKAMEVIMQRTAQGP